MKKGKKTSVRRVANRKNIAAKSKRAPIGASASYFFGEVEKMNFDQYPVFGERAGGPEQQCGDTGIC